MAKRKPTAFAVGNLVRVTSHAGDGSRYGQLAIITGVRSDFAPSDARTVRYLADGVDDWWFVSQIEEPEEQADENTESR